MYKSHFHADPNVQLYRTASFLLCWCFGLIIGVYSFSQASSASLTLIRTSLDFRVSIVTLVVSALLPIVLSALAFRLCVEWAAYLVCFFKAFSFAYCSVGICLAFTGAGWLFRTMMLFSDIGSILFLFWFTLRNLLFKRCHARKDFWVGFFGIVGVVVIDYYTILPLLTDLTK